MKLLVIASEPLTAERLRAATRGRHDDRELEVLVISPALHESMLRFWMSDADEAIARAERVERATVADLRHEGIRAAGDTGESTVIEAVEDVLATFPADRILLFVHPERDELYGEHVDVEQLEERVGVAVERVDAATSS